MGRWVRRLATLFTLGLLLTGGGGGGGGEVTYDGRSVVIGGERKLLFSGSIHYPRSTPQMWASLIAKAKDGGLDVIQTYVFWNLHEPQPGQYDFDGRHDLVKFIKEIQAQGLYVCLRIGPFIESEWSYGGFPFWLHDVPGIVFRTNNEPFKFYMQNFTSKILDLMKSENLYASQGGPIILSQIENEYQNVEAAFGKEGPIYVDWAAKMAVGMQTGVPWLMCKQTDAPDPVVFGGDPYLRSAEDIAFHVALFIAKNGSYVNYYMYHGGTNFGRTASAYVTTSYYDEAPLDEYGLLRQPKWGHLKQLHLTIRGCSETILNGVQSNISLGQLQKAYVFEEANGCVAFLINNDSMKSVGVVFRNTSLDLPPKSISILPDCVNVAFNTANITTEYNERNAEANVNFNSEDMWEAFNDVVPNFSNTSFMADSLLEQMNTTKDQSDYLWYTFRFELNSSCDEPKISIVSLAHAALAFHNNTYIGGNHGNHNIKNFTLETQIPLYNGSNDISILSVMTGLPDSGAFMESKFAGLAKVEIRCSESITYDVSNYTWGYQIGLLGESLQIYLEENVDKVIWSSLQDHDSQPLTWYKATFDSPMGDEPVTLNLSSMGKGEAWVNGQSIGRYWVSFLTPKGLPSQTLYHVPRSFLKPLENLLVLMEEEASANPLQVSLNIISTTALTSR
ncbi:hypothetical protein V2J09_000706 [Rumex salicifolius]